MFWILSIKEFWLYFFIRNIFQDEKISDYKKRYEDIKNDLSKLIIQSSIININKELKQKTQNIKVKSNTTKTPSRLFTSRNTQSILYHHTLPRNHGHRRRGNFSRKAERRHHTYLPMLYEWHQTNCLPWSGISAIWPASSQLRHLGGRPLG